MNRRWLLAGIATTLVSVWSATASAEDAKGFGNKGQLILSADRLMPLFSWTSTSVEFTDNANVKHKETNSGTSMSFLWGNDRDVAFKVHTVPRVGFDFTIIDRLTLGGSVAVAFGLGGSTTTTTTAPNGNSVEQKADSPNTTVVGVQPRVGYILPIGDVLALWLRGGFAFYSVSSKTSDTNNQGVEITQKDSGTLFSLDLDPQLMIVPMEHFFINVGPLINFPLAGSLDHTTSGGGTTVTTSNDLTQWHIGISAGLGGWFNL